MALKNYRGGIVFEGFPKVGQLILIGIEAARTIQYDLGTLIDSLVGTGIGLGFQIGLRGSWWSAATCC